MTVLHIAEFDQTCIEVGNSAQVALSPPIAEQKITVEATSVQSAAFSPLTSFVRLKARGGDCAVAWGANPVATDANMPLDAGDTEYFGVPAGSKLAVIANAS